MSINKKKDIQKNMFENMKKNCVMSVTYFFIILFMMSFVLISGCSRDTEPKNADKSLSNIIDKGTLIVGTSPPYGLMEFYDETGAIVGIDIDMAERIAEDIGVTLEVKNIDFDLMADSLNSGEIDIFISAVSITPERSKILLFSVPYFNGGQVLVTSFDSIEIEEVEMVGHSAFNGKRIIVEESGTSINNAILSYVKDPVLIPVSESELDDVKESYLTQSVYMLKNGDADAFVIDYVAAVELVKQDSSLMIHGAPFTQEFYGIVAKKGNNALISRVNDVLREMKQNREIVLIMQKWSD
jgi:polar amino acid transport system substrate-binding protein